jgi:hypothetical protein
MEEAQPTPAEMRTEAAGIGENEEEEKGIWG